MTTNNLYSEKTGMIFKFSSGNMRDPELMATELIGYYEIPRNEYRYIPPGEHILFLLGRRDGGSLKFRYGGTVVKNNYPNTITLLNDKRVKWDIDIKDSIIFRRHKTEIYKTILKQYISKQIQELKYEIEKSKIKNNDKKNNKINNVDKIKQIRENYSIGWNYKYCSDFSILENGMYLTVVDTEKKEKYVGIINMKKNNNSLSFVTRIFDKLTYKNVYVFQYMYVFILVGISQL